MARQQLREPPDLPDLGEWTGQCGPGTSTSKFDAIWGYATLGIGLVFLIFSLFSKSVLPGKNPKDATAVQVFFVLIGCLIFLIGLALVIFRWFEERKEIHLFQKGIVKRSGNSLQIAPWKKISKLILKEHFVSPSSPMTYRVVVVVNGQRKIRFPSTMVGDSKKIINRLSKKVEDVEVIAWEG
jgi:hypothetical protein